jgi:hypothetical protein
MTDRTGRTVSYHSIEAARPNPSEPDEDDEDMEDEELSGEDDDIIEEEDIEDDADGSPTR